MAVFYAGLLLYDQRVEAPRRQAAQESVAGEISARRGEWLREGRSKALLSGGSVTEVILVDPYMDELNSRVLLYRDAHGSTMLKLEE